MDAATLQARIYAGYSKAAQRIGTSHAHYRPATISNPLASGNQIGTLLSNFNIRGGYSGQSVANQLYWQIIADGAQLQVGDYLVADHTYCVLALDHLLPPIALRCTQVLTFSRETVNQDAGLQSYSDLSGQAAYAQSVPGVINVKKETGKPTTGLPGDNALRTFYSAFFYLPDGLVQTRDQVIDQNNVRYQVVSCSSGLLGYEALLELLEA